MSYATLPEETRYWARAGILDTIGVTVAGSREAAPRLAAEALDLHDGPALILGRRRRVDLLEAAVVNGTASHVLDFDDSSNTMGGHPSAILTGALLPLADMLGSPGSDVVAAYVAGFEVQSKIGLGVNFHHYSKGWHPTSTLGAFGAAAAASRLMGLDEAETAVALAIAASFASGLKANFGTMTKPLHVGHCVRNGLYAARLAAKGFTANAGSVFEHGQGFLDVFNGKSNYDMAPTLSTWARPYDLTSPGIAVKQYPCCGSTHPAIDATLAIFRAHRPDPARIARIDAAIHARRLTHVNRPHPQSPLDAKFSVQYVISRAIADGRVAVGDFHDGALEDDRIRALLPKVHMSAYNETGVGDFSADNHFGGHVTITMEDGSKLSARVEQPEGRTTANPMPQSRLRAKFALCVEGLLQDDRIGPIADMVEHLEALPDMGELTETIRNATLSD
ncbi:MmgE/PrpD family protein [Pigmentiphaga soli]|uniref:MmgE/PrpD family protein n=2 Tax=Pigmentiphaga soli TaxID=1007095 RepID=A0ABP8HIA6_9BURK